MPDFFLDIEPQKIVSKHGVRMFSTSATTRRAESTGSEDSGPDGVFKAIKGRLNPDLVNSTQAVFQFNLNSGLYI